MNILDILEERGYIEQVTYKDSLRELTDKERFPFYIGIDPTADSLHVGHFVSLMVASHMQKAGFTPIILMGGGTATIGDPSGKTDMRRMMTKEEIDHNIECIKKQVSRFVSFEGENSAIILNNGDWLLDKKYVDFMREIGTKFTVSRMLAADCYKNRLETGLTFFEMGYMLMQSYDFLHLYNTHGCKLQLGGNDQWSNIIGGVELIRKFNHDDAFGLTFKLLTTKEGKKMGKTEKGALWLDATKTSPFDFYQYWRNIDDGDVKKVMCMLTFLPMDEINELTNVEGEEINKAKKVAAYEITKLVHGEEAAKKAEEATSSLFGGDQNSDNIPKVKIEHNATIISALVSANFATSNSQAKQLVMQGGVSLNDEKITDINFVINDDLLAKEPILRKGKKGYCKLVG